MNQHEPIEQLLLRLTRPSAPLDLRTAVLDAIDAQRDADTRRHIVATNHNRRRWMAKLDRAATFAAPCLLAISILLFAFVHRSADNLYGGHGDTVSQGRPTTPGFSLAESEPPLTPQAFFRQHFAILQNLNTELFSETSQSQKTPQVDNDRAPFGHFRRDPDRHISELECLTRSGSTARTAA